MRVQSNENGTGFDNFVCVKWIKYTHTKQTLIPTDTFHFSRWTRRISTVYTYHLYHNLAVLRMTLTQKLTLPSSNFSIHFSAMLRTVFYFARFSTLHETCTRVPMHKCNVSIDSQYSRIRRLKFCWMAT